MKNLLIKVLIVWAVVGVVAYFFSISGYDHDNLYKAVAKEYNIKVSTVRNDFGLELDLEGKYFPVPHVRWYVHLENGDDVTIANEYFGMMFLDTDAIDKYYPFKAYRDAGLK